MNNWKLRAVYSGDSTMDWITVNGYLAGTTSSEPMMRVIPFGDKYAAPLRTSGGDTFGPVSNQVPGICNGTFTHTGSGSATVSATTLTGEGSGATFTYTFLADGTLSTIVAATAGSGYLVGDKLRITTSASHGSQVIEFRLVDGSNGTSLNVRLIHDRNNPLPFPVHRARVNESTSYAFQVLDYRSSQVFPRPQDKLLDKYPDAAAAYGLRLLRSAYQGPCIRVQRSSDNALVDIGFKGNSIDLQALQDFVGEYDGRVRTWYDQSGNGNDAEQTNTSQRPKIIIGGVLQTVNGKPALEFDGSDDSFSVTGFTNAASNYSMFSVVQVNDAVAGGRVFDTQSGRLIIDSRNSSAGAYFDGGWRGDRFTHLNQAVTSLHLISPSSGATYVDGVATNLSKVYTQTAIGGNVRLGSNDAGDANFWDGTMQEVVLYAADKTSDREDIEKDMGLFYSAFGMEDAPLLDAYGGAHAAYSLRKLNSDYTGAAIRVVRSEAGYPEQDIGFDANGNIDEQALETFSQGKGLLVKTLYDQSGNGNDTTQTALNDMPLVRDDSALMKVDGRVAMRFNGTSQALPFDETGLDIGNISAFAVFKYSTTTGTQRALSLSGYENNRRFYIAHMSGGNFAYTYGNASVGSATGNTNNNLHTMIAGATQGDAEGFVNGASVGTATLVTGAAGNDTGIGALGGSDYMNGFIQEVVVYSSDQSERREGIERNISNHYDL